MVAFNKKTKGEKKNAQKEKDENDEIVRTVTTKNPIPDSQR